MNNYEKPDFWSVKAQKEAYPARSVYKLKEMDEKYSLFKNPSSKSLFKVLDLGASPGSWSLYVLRKKIPCFLTAIDLSPLSKGMDRGLFESKNFLFIEGDMLEEKNREIIVQNGPYNLVLCDAAPLTTGNRSIDTLRSLELAETAVDYAEKNLAPGGNLAVKIFQGNGSTELLKRINSIFEKAKSCKPKACRAESFEIYFLGLGRKTA